MEKYFTDNSLLQLDPQKPTTTKSKSVWFNLDSFNQVCHPAQMNPATTN